MYFVHQYRFVFVTFVYPAHTDRQVEGLGMLQANFRCVVFYAIWNGDIEGVLCHMKWRNWGGSMPYEMAKLGEFYDQINLWYYCDCSMSSLIFVGNIITSERSERSSY